METVKIDPRGVNAGVDQHSTVWPEVGAICPDNTQPKPPPSTGALHVWETFVIASSLKWSVIAQT